MSSHDWLWRGGNDWACRKCLRLVHVPDNVPFPECSCDDVHHDFKWVEQRASVHWFKCTRCQKEVGRTHDNWAMPQTGCDGGYVPNAQ